MGGGGSCGGLHAQKSEDGVGFGPNEIDQKRRGLSTDHGIKSHSSFEAYPQDIQGFGSRPTDTGAR